MPHFNGWLSCALNDGDNRRAVAPDVTEKLAGASG